MSGNTDGADKPSKHNQGGFNEHVFHWHTKKPRRCEVVRAIVRGKIKSRAEARRAASRRMGRKQQTGNAGRISPDLEFFGRDGVDAFDEENAERRTAMRSAVVHHYLVLGDGREYPNDKSSPQPTCIVSRTSRVVGRSSSSENGRQVGMSFHCAAGRLISSAAEHSARRQDRSAPLDLNPPEDQAVNLKCARKCPPYEGISSQLGPRRESRTLTVLPGGF